MEEELSSLIQFKDSTDAEQCYRQDNKNDRFCLCYKLTALRQSTLFQFKSDEHRAKAHDKGLIHSA